MVSVPMDVYLQDSEALAGEFDRALQENDSRELSRILRMISELFEHVVADLNEKYGDGTGARLEARTRYRWDGWLPANVMHDLRGAKMINELWIERIEKEVPNLSKGARQMARLGRKRLESNLRAKIRDGRRWMIKQWPGWWTPEAEKFFENWL